MQAVNKSVNSPGRLSLRSRLQSIAYALRGLAIIVKGEPNAIIHSFGLVIVLIGALIKQPSKVECVLLAIAVGLVWITEAINTAIEKLCDMYSTAFHPMIKIIKDVAAAAVLIAAFTSIAIGTIVFFF